MLGIATASRVGSDEKGKGSNARERAPPGRPVQVLSESCRSNGGIEKNFSRTPFSPSGSNAKPAKGIQDRSRDRPVRPSIGRGQTDIVTVRTGHRAIFKGLCQARGMDPGDPLP